MATVGQVQASSAVTESTHLDPALTSMNVGGPFLMPAPLCGSLSQPGAKSRHALPVTVNSNGGGTQGAVPLPCCHLSAKVRNTQVRTPV